MCLNQSNVQIAVLNFSLYYEWLNFYNPLLFSLHPTSLSKWKSQLIIWTCPAMIQRWSSDDPAVSQRTPLGDFPCLGCRQITPGSPSGVPTENSGSPFGRLWFFFCQLHTKFPWVAEQRPAGDRAASRGTPADELICVTSADHPAKFNCELNLPGAAGRVPDEGYAGGSPQDFCRIWCKTRRTVAVQPIFLYWDVGFSKFEFQIADML